MKVVILTEGGKAIGYGHISRCIALYQAFEERGTTPELIINGDNSIKDSISSTKSRIYNWLANQSVTISRISRNDLVIIDSYFATKKFYNQIAEIVKLPVFIDDNYRISYPHGIIINGNIYADKSKYGNKESMYLIGSKYCLLRRDFKDVIKKKIRDRIKEILVTFGYNDWKNLTPNVMDLLNNYYPDITKNIIIGKGFTNISDIETLKNKNTNLLYYPEVRDIINAMHRSDLAISAGGQTLYELAVCGVPTIAISTSENQKNNINGWLKTGFIEYTGEWDHKRLLENLHNKIKLLCDYVKRERSSKIGKRYVDSTGSDRIIHILLRKSRVNNYE